jgi:hypothetical protein
VSSPGLFDNIIEAPPLSPLASSVAVAEAGSGNKGKEKAKPRFSSNNPVGISPYPTRASSRTPVPHYINNPSSKLAGPPLVRDNLAILANMNKSSSGLDQKHQKKSQRPWLHLVPEDNEDSENAMNSKPITAYFTQENFGETDYGEAALMNEYPRQPSTPSSSNIKYSGKPIHGHLAVLDIEEKFEALDFLRDDIIADCESGSVKTAKVHSNKPTSLTPSREHKSASKKTAGSASKKATVEHDESEFTPKDVMQYYDVIKAIKAAQHDSSAVTKDDFLDYFNTVNEQCEEYDRLTKDQVKAKYTSNLSNSKGKFFNMFHKRAPSQDGTTPTRMTRRVGGVSGKPTPNFDQERPLTPASTARTASRQTATANARIRSARQPLVFNPGSSVDSKRVLTELDQGHALVMHLLNDARLEENSPRKDGLLQLGRLLVGVVTETRGAVQAADNAKLMAQESELRLAQTLAQCQGVITLLQDYENKAHWLDPYSRNMQ